MSQARLPNFISLEAIAYFSHSQPERQYIVHTQIRNYFRTMGTTAVSHNCLSHLVQLLTLRALSLLLLPSHHHHHHTCHLLHPLFIHTQTQWPVCPPLLVIFYSYMVDYRSLDLAVNLCTALHSKWCCPAPTTFHTLFLHLFNSNGEKHKKAEN